MDAGPLVRDLADQAAAIAAAKNISVSLRLEADRLPVKANDAKLRRLLLILVDNALKYTPSGGSVTVEGSSDSTQSSNIRKPIPAPGSRAKICRMSSNDFGGLTRCGLARRAAADSAWPSPNRSPICMVPTLAVQSELARAPCSQSIFRGPRARQISDSRRAGWQPSRFSLGGLATGMCALSLA